MRPRQLADDHSGTIDVIAHATAWAQGRNWSPDAVCCIYATAPFLQPGDLRRGLELLESGPWRYAFSVTEFSTSIFRAFRLADKGGKGQGWPHPTARRDALRYGLSRANRTLGGVLN